MFLCYMFAQVTAAIPDAVEDCYGEPSEDMGPSRNEELQQKQTEPLPKKSSCPTTPTKSPTSSLRRQLFMTPSPQSRKRRTPSPAQGEDEGSAHTASPAPSSCKKSDKKKTPSPKHRDPQKSKATSPCDVWLVCV